MAQSRASGLRELTLIVTDLYLAPASEERTEASPIPVEPSVASTSLPALERILARASTRHGGDWRAWLGSQAGWSREVATPVAAISRCAVRDPAPGEWWLATPVHLEAALDHVRLALVLSLSQAEWAVLAASFRNDFASAPLELVDGNGAAGFLLAGRAIDVRTIDPARTIGRDLHGALPAGAESALMKRLMTEIQMWLHTHPLNVERESQGQLPANGLWIWGGGALVPIERGAVPVLLADDLFARGLWRLAGASVNSLPPRLEPGMIAPTSEQGSLLIVISLAQLNGASDHERMEALDRSWLQPALDAVRAGAVAELRLHLNDRYYALKRTDLLRFWRPRRPWLEAIT